MSSAIRPLADRAAVLALVEWLERHDEQRTVRLHLAVEHAVADDRGDAGNSFGLADDLLDLLGDRVGAIDGSTFRQLDLAEDGALVLGGQKARRRDPEQPTRAAKMTASAIRPNAATRTSRLTIAA